MSFPWVTESDQRFLDEIDPEVLRRVQAQMLAEAEYSIAMDMKLSADYWFRGKVCNIAWYNMGGAYNGM